MEMTDFGGDLASHAEFKRVPGYAPVRQRTLNPAEQRAVPLVLGEPPRLDAVPTPEITVGFYDGSQVCTNFIFFPVHTPAAGMQFIANLTALQPNRPEDESETDLLEEAGKRCKIYVNICIYVLLLLIAGWVIVTYLYFTYAMTILAALDVAWMTYTLIQICRVRKEDMADTMRLLSQGVWNDA